MPLPILAIASALSAFAPALMKYFGAGETSVAIAEKVVGMAQTVTGSSTPEEALERIRADAAAQTAFQLEVMKNETELDRIYLADRQSARDRDVEIVRIRGRNLRGDILAYLAVGSLIMVIVLLFAGPALPEPSERLLYTVLGALIMIVKEVYGFEFGSSKDSQRNAQAVVDTLNRTE